MQRITKNKPSFRHRLLDRPCITASISADKSEKPSPVSVSSYRSENGDCKEGGSWEGGRAMASAMARFVRRLRSIRNGWSHTKLRKKAELLLERRSCSFTSSHFIEATMVVQPISQRSNRGSIQLWDLSMHSGTSEEAVVFE